MSSSLSSEVRVKLHVISESGFGINGAEEGIDKVFFDYDLVDDLCKGLAVKLINKY